MKKVATIMTAGIPRRFLCRHFGHRLKSTKSNDGYFERRLRDLKEQNTIQGDDPLAKLAHIVESESLADQDTDLRKLYESMPQKEFEKKFNAEICYLKMGDHIDRQSKEIALSRPWGGRETLEETALRMLLDVSGKPKTLLGGDRGLVIHKAENKEARPIRASKQLRKKLESAQDHVIMYKNDSKRNAEDLEQSEFRTLYAEKFTPIGSFEKIRSLADQRIEEGRRNGGFDGLEKVRGKPLNLPGLNQHVDMTEHYLNNMLARQKIVPPWIEAQSRVNRESAELRSYLVNQFECELISNLGNSRELTAKHDFTEFCVLIKDKYGSTENFVLNKFAAWKSSFMPHMIGKIKALNKDLRDFNLQAPLSLQKLYLRPESEFQRVLKETNLEIVIEKILQKKSKQQLYKDGGAPKNNVSVFASIFRLWK